MNNLNLQTVASDPQQRKQQTLESSNTLNNYFLEVVEFVRNEVLASVPTTSIEHAEIIIDIHSKNWRPVYNHILSVH